MTSQNRLNYLRESKVEGCGRCALHRKRNRLVFGVGNPDADLVFVGEAPGREENQAGEPFVGMAGRLLNSFLRRVDLSREDTYICNIVKCWPPGNRDPEPEEIAACSPFLHMQLRIIRPKVIVALGRFAGRVLTGEGEDASLGYLRNHDWTYHNETTELSCPVVVTYHPSYILRNQDDPKAAKEAAMKVQSDLYKALRVVEG